MDSAFKQWKTKLQRLSRILIRTDNYDFSQLDMTNDSDFVTLKVFNQTSARVKAEMLFRVWRHSLIEMTYNGYTFRSRSVNPIRRLKKWIRTILANEDYVNVNSYRSDDLEHVMLRWQVRVSRHSGASMHFRNMINFTFEAQSAEKES